MFIKFFLTFSDDQLTSGSVGRRGIPPSNPSSNYTIPLSDKLTLDSVIHSIAYKFGIVEQYVCNTRESTRDILVNISDEVMFQLELMAHITEESYCTYNLESKLFGFGDTKRNASDASLSRNISPSGSSGSSIGSSPNLPQSESFFSFNPKIHSVPKLKYQVPEAFSNDLLQELNAYIVFEKIHMFQESVTNLHINGHKIRDYINLFFDEENRNKIKVLPVVPVEHISMCFDFYINDDIDIFSSKTRYESSFEFMRSICCEIMQLTNETF